VFSGGWEFGGDGLSGNLWLRGDSLEWGYEWFGPLKQEVCNSASLKLRRTGTPPAFSGRKVSGFGLLRTVKLEGG